MRKRLWWLAGLTGAVVLSLGIPTGASEDVSGMLQRQTQEMADAIATGSVAVWDRYLGESVAYTTEEGTVLNRAQMLAQTKPLPAGVSGNIKVTDFKVAVHGPVAIATYVDDEHETYHGHALHCQ